MKHKKVKCIMCGAETKVPAINEPWCDACVEREQLRSGKEDLISFARYKRPPRYVLVKEDWPRFGYSEKVGWS